jgi:hypothetical protein
MIRKVIIPRSDKINVSLTIPEKYIGRELEVIAFSTDEGIENKEVEANVQFTVVNVEDKNYKFNRDEANER